MKAITIHQPWATLIAVGEKRFETRSWPAKYRGPIAIHAGKKVDREACEQEPIKSTLAKHGYTADNLPIGSVVATAILKASVGVGGINKELGIAALYGSFQTGTRTIGGDEYHFGFYDNGRYAWELTDVERLPDPIPAKGQQGLWNWEEANHAG